MLILFDSPQDSFPYPCVFCHLSQGNLLDSRCVLRYFPKVSFSSTEKSFQGKWFEANGYPNRFKAWGSRVQFFSTFTHNSKKTLVPKKASAFFGPLSNLFQSLPTLSDQDLFLRISFNMNGSLNDDKIFFRMLFKFFDGDSRWIGNLLIDCWIIFSRMISETQKRSVWSVTISSDKRVGIREELWGFHLIESLSLLRSWQRWGVSL